MTPLEPTLHNLPSFMGNLPSQFAQGNTQGALMLQQLTLYKLPLSAALAEAYWAMLTLTL